MGYICSMKKSDFNFDVDKYSLLFFNSLSERNKRLYAGIESMKLGYYGVDEVAKKFGMHKHTVRRGQKELLSEDLLPTGQVRRSGGGRKKKVDSTLNIVSVFLMVVNCHTAGDPMRSGVLWTDLTCREISGLLRPHAIHAGVYVVKQLLKMGGYVKRKMSKCRTLKEVKDRNGQFEHIARLKEEFNREGLPVLSMDSKKKEMLGNFYREGRLYAREAQKVYDHDFNSFSKGTVIPHGIYDVNRDKCYLTIGRTKDTAEFVCDNIEHHWNGSIKHLYPSAKRMLVLCDGGGSNSCRHFVVKEQLQKLSERIKMDITVAHYPAY